MDRPTTVSACVYLISGHAHDWFQWMKIESNWTKIKRILGSLEKWKGNG